MHSSSRSRLVDQAPLQVWEQLADFASISRWAKGIGHSAPLTAPATGLGAVRRVQVGRQALRERVVGWEPTRLVVYEVHGLPRAVRRATATWTLTPEGGGTRVTVTYGVVTRPPLLAHAVGRRLGRVADRLLDDLSQHCCALEAAP